MTADPVEELIDVPSGVKYPQGEGVGKVMKRRVQHTDIGATVASHMNKEVPTPDETYPLSKPTERITISKSNTSIRITGPDAYAIRRRDGTEDTFEDPQNKIMNRFRHAEFPDVRTSSGVVQGIEDADCVEQLKTLGYR